jgi:hypothetical protein
MGKYPPSKLRAAFSEWHWKKLNSHSTGMDIDFIETKKENGSYIPIGILEIARPKSRLTDQALDIYIWLAKTTKLPVYVIYTEESFSKFEIWYFPTELRKSLSEFDFIKWLDGLRGYKSNYNADKIDWDSIKKQFCNIKTSSTCQRSLCL